MLARRLVLGLFVVLLGGCPVENGPDLLNGSVGRFLSDVLQNLTFRPVPAGRVQVRFQNDSSSAADTRVTMRVAGNLVHLAERHLMPKFNMLTVGPDWADTVVVEVTLTSPVRRSLPIASFLLGRDFQPGDTIIIAIPPDERPQAVIRIAGLDADLHVVAGTPVEFDLLVADAESDAVVRAFADPDSDPDNGNELSIVEGLPVAERQTVTWDTTDVASGAYAVYAELLQGEQTIRTGPAPGRVFIDRPPPPQQASVRIEGLDADRRLNAGTPVDFDVVVENADVDAVLRAFADPDDDPANGNEIAIADGLAPAARQTVSWQTGGLDPGLYAVYAELLAEDSTVRAGPAPGRVRINAQPQFVFSDPRERLLLTRGRTFIAAWVAVDDDDDAVIRVFLDDDQDAENGLVRLLADGVSEDDVANRELHVETADLAAARLFVGAQISDGLSQLTVYAGPIGLTERLVGRFTPAELAAGERVVIDGTLGDGLGAALDATGDLDGDGLADLFIGAPGTRAGDIVPGAVFVARGRQDWPALLPVAQLDTRIVGAKDGALVGERLARFPRSAAPAPNLVDLLIGSPMHRLPDRGAAGRAFRLNGASLVGAGEVNLGELLRPEKGSLVERPRSAATGSIINGAARENTGLDAAALGDLDGDGLNDFALGGTGWGERREGRVAIIGGDARFAEISTDDIGSFGDGLVRGALAVSDRPRSQTGYAVRGVRDFDADGYDEILIGAPGAATDDGARNGAAYLVLGSRNIFDDDGKGGNVIPLELVGRGVRGHAFIGENADDLAGAALAALDFDGDGSADVLIGAPGFDAARGRVYLIYNRPGLPGVVPLGDVGGPVEGVVFEGLAAGDQFGISLASAGDADGDGVDDLLIGAAGARTLAGAAFLIFGGQPLAGPVTLFDLPSIDLQGWQLLGGSADGRLGAAVSGGGDLNGDGLADAAVGAPTDQSESPGSTVVVFGRGG